MNGKRMLDILTRLDEDIIEESERYKADEKLIADSKKHGSYKAVILALSFVLCIVVIVGAVIKNVIISDSDEDKASVGKEAVNKNGKNSKNDFGKTEDKEIVFSFDSKGYREVSEKLDILEEKAIKGGKYFLYKDIVECLGEPDISYERIKDSTTTGSDSNENGVISAYKWVFDDGFYICAENGDNDSSLVDHFGIVSGCYIDGVDISGDFEDVAKDEEGFSELEDMIQRILDRKSFEDAPYYKGTKVDRLLNGSIPDRKCRFIDTEKFYIKRNIDAEYTGGSFYYRYPNDVILSAEETQNIKDQYESIVIRHMQTGGITIDGAGDYQSMEYRYVMKMHDSVTNAKDFNDVENIIGEPDQIGYMDGNEAYCYSVGKFTLKIIKEKYGIAREVVFNDNDVILSRGVRAEQNVKTPEEITEEARLKMKEDYSKEITEQDKQYAALIKEDLNKIVIDQEYKKSLYSKLDKFISENKEEIYKCAVSSSYIKIEWIDKYDYLSGWGELVSIVHDRTSRYEYAPYILNYIIDNNLTGLDGGYLVFLLRDMTGYRTEEDSLKNYDPTNTYDTVYGFAYQWWNDVRKEFLR